MLGPIELSPNELGPMKVDPIELGINFVCSAAEGLYGM